MHLKKYTLATAVFLVTFSATMGQPQINSPEKAYDYWAKRGIIEMINAFMKDYIITINDSLKIKNEIEGQRVYLMKFINEIDQKDISTISSEFEQVPQFLKSNHWPGAEKNLFKPLHEKYKNSDSIAISFFTTTKPASIEKSTYIPGYKNKLENWERAQQRILEKYNNLLENLSKKGTNEIRNLTKDSVELAIPQNSISNNADKYNVSIVVRRILISLFILFLGGLIIFYITKSSINSILKNEKASYLDELRSSDLNYFFKYIGLVKMLKKRKDDYKEENKKLQNNNINEWDMKRKIEILTKEIEQLRSENLNFKKVNKDVIGFEPLNPKEEGNVQQNTKIISILYFSIPESDGCFSYEKGDISDDDRKFYRIEFFENSSDGKLYFNSSERDKRAINRLESYLKPVCEIENITEADSAKSIELIKPGKVNLINDCWVIDPENKVKVKLV